MKGIRRALFRVAFLAVLILCFGCESNDSTLQTSPRKGEPAIKPGGDAPEFELIDMSGRALSLQSYKGKVVLLNFWATWCVPCVMEMPALERLSQMLAPKGLVVLGVNLDNESNREKVSQFIESYGLTFDVALDPNFTTAKLYGVTGFPETIFVSRDGKLLEVWDPLGRKPTVRFLSDRPWDSEQYVKAVEDLLQ